jgi:hypothetical protein
MQLHRNYLGRFEKALNRLENMSGVSPGARRSLIARLRQLEYESHTGTHFWFYD